MLTLSHRDWTQALKKKTCKNRILYSQWSFCSRVALMSPSSVYGSSACYLLGPEVHKQTRGARGHRCNALGDRNFAVMGVQPLHLFPQFGKSFLTAELGAATLEALSLVSARWPLDKVGKQ